MGAQAGTHHETIKVKVGAETPGVMVNQGDYWLEETKRHAGMHHHGVVLPNDNNVAVSFGDETVGGTSPFAGSGMGNHYDHWPRLGDGPGGGWAADSRQQVGLLP